MKTCAKCRRDLPLASFRQRRRRGRVEYRSRCVECCRPADASQMRKWYARPENKAKVKDRQLRKQYGITLQDWQHKLAVQEGLCAICQEPMTDKINVDHDHNTGEVRDLLCSGCNGGLGCFRDDPRLLAAGIAYLARWGRK